MNNEDIDHLLIREVYGRYNNVPLDDFTGYIKDNGIKCITIDAYTSFDPGGNATGKLRFLEPDKKFQKDWAFYKPSSNKTILHLFGM